MPNLIKNSRSTNPSIVVHIKSNISVYKIVYLKKKNIYPFSKMDKNVSMWETAG